MMRVVAVAVFVAGLALAAAGQSSPDKVRSTNDFSDIQREVETLRGKMFVKPVPVYQISPKEMRAISDRELDKQYPGEKLKGYEELQVWLDLMPPGTDLKAASAAYEVGQVAGLYDSDTKEMCIPAPTGVVTNAGKKAAQNLTPNFDTIVLAHEFTHALEDQYWPLDDPEDTNMSLSTDRGTGHDFVLEGSATREMVEVVPAQWSQSPTGYFFFWNLIHSGFGEFVLQHGLESAWKSPEAVVPGVPESLARSEAMPYGYGYAFCAEVTRQWGLDGLDYIYNHPVTSSEQVMHPQNAWEWHRFPVQIHLPERLDGGWKQVSMDSEGEAGIAILFGCQFKNLNRGLELARGWDGDHVALFAGPEGHRLLLWASAWESASDAAEFVNAFVKERQIAHRASITQKTGTRAQWESADGRAGFLQRNGKQVILLETDDRDALRNAEAFASQITFTTAPEETARAAENNAWRRFDPLWSWQKDEDYTVTRSLGGLLSRHDRNSVGSADVFVGGALAESRRTASFRKWEIGGGFVAKHESDTRRGYAKTTWLPWGVLASRSSARLPQSPEKTITRSSLLWGAAGSITTKGEDERSLHVLPFGLLFCSTHGPGLSSVHVLGTGFTTKEATEKTAATTRFRFLGITLWTTRAPGATRK